LSRREEQRVIAGRLPAGVLRRGKVEPPPVRIPLRAGPLSLVFEGGDLRYIRLGDREVLRRVYVAVRDRNWGTVPVVLLDMRVDVGSDSFSISYHAEHKQADIAFAWEGSITGDSAGTITCSMDGTARSTFLRNRIGFCVLHPIRECAGQPCTIDHADGSTEHGEFPPFISPHQPFVEMRTITHEVLPGVRAEVRFEGDIFEMEDQRNWTDASYKTYCTPLRLPYPVEIRAGDRVAQAVTLRLHTERPQPQVRARPAELTYSIRDLPTVPLPRIGLGVSTSGETLGPHERMRLRALNPAHLRVDLELSAPEYPAVLERASQTAMALGASLEVALFLSDSAEQELERLVALLERTKPPVAAWLIFRATDRLTGEGLAGLARHRLTPYEPRARFGSGTDAYFTQLNRARPSATSLDFVCYSVNPQVHAFDDASLVETLEAQGATVKSARRLYDGLPLAVTPVTLKPRYNLDATGTEPPLAAGELPRAVDPRQMSLLCAGWTVGSLKYLSESGAASMTYYETAGWQGVVTGAAGSRIPDKSPSLPGCVFPVYHVLADIGEFSGGEVVSTASSDALLADGICVRKGNRTMLLLANLGPERQTVILRGLVGPVRMRTLDETTAREAMDAPEEYRSREGASANAAPQGLRLDLLPFAVVRVDAP
jgi:hypothetical protein